MLFEREGSNPSGVDPSFGYSFFVFGLACPFCSHSAVVRLLPLLAYGGAFSFVAFVDRWSQN